MWFYRYGSECIEVSEALQSVSHVIFPQHNHQSQLQYTQNTYKALSSPRNSPSINYLRGFPLSNLSFPFHSNLPLHHATTLYSIPLVPKPLSSPSLLLPVFHLFPITVYLMQSKLLHSSQTLITKTSITASHNLVLCLSITPHFPPLYVGVALYHCMTDYHFTLSSRTLF